MKNPVSKEQTTLWLESKLIENIRLKAKELDVQFESIVEDALFEVFEPSGLQRVYGQHTPPQIRFRTKADSDKFKRD